jgi:assimilatory nitrate reductase catalytic subunit
VPAEQGRGAGGLPAAASPAAGGPGAYVLTGRGVEQHHDGTDTVTAAIDLALALGLPGRVGSGYGCLTGQGNGQGGREHGQKADQLPGYRRIDDPAARAHVAGVWGCDPDELPGPGYPAVELLDRLGRPGGPRALLVHGSNVVVSAPDAARVTERLRALDLLVVCDLVLSETAALADVVLPVAQWAEEEGTMTNLEGRVLRRRRALPPPAGVRDELEVLASLAARLGHPTGFPTDAAQAFAELARASAGGPADYSGLDHDRVDDEAAPAYWPAPPAPAGSPAIAPPATASPATASAPGTPRPFTDRFATPDGRARMLPVTWRGPADPVRDGMRVHLVTGRLLEHYQSGAQTRRVLPLAAAEPEAFVQMHPHLAASLRVEDGDLLRVTSARGSAVAPARVSDAVRPDTVFMPFHFAGPGSANLVTSPAVDPVSRMPELKTCAVHVTREAP